jgi:ribosomal protein S18 acetylase RimI-like enzyme
MKVVGYYQQNKLLFKSYNQPIRKFAIEAGEDIIRFEEIDYKSKNQGNLINKISEFFVDNFARQSKNPFFKNLKRNSKDFNQNSYDTFKKESETIPIKKMISTNDDTTLLIGYNKRGEISAGIFAHPLDIEQGVKDNDTLYINSLAVSPKYRGHHVGEVVLDKVLDSVGDRYSDVFLEAFNEATPFYQKLGFKQVSNPNLTTELSKTNPAYPKYETFMEKTLDESQKRWSDRLTSSDK